MRECAACKSAMLALTDLQEVCSELICVRFWEIREKTARRKGMVVAVLESGMAAMVRGSGCVSSTPHMALTVMCEGSSCSCIRGGFASSAA